MELAQKLSTLHRMYGRFFIHLRPDLHLLSVTVAAVLAIAITNTALIWLIGTPFDLIQRRKFNEVYGAIILFAIVVLLNQGLHSAEGLLSRWTGLRFARRLRSHLFSHLLYVSFPGVADRQKGDLLARLYGDVNDVKNLVIETPLDIASHTFTLIFYCVMIFWIEWRLALLAVSIAPVFILHQRFFGPRKRTATRVLHAAIKEDRLDVPFDSSL